METAALDLEVVAARATAAAGAPVTGLRPLPGGLSSITLAGVLGTAAPIVVKVAPPGLEPVRNRDVLRQARLLAALAPVDGVAVPEVLFTDDQAPPLFGMRFVPGDSFEPVTSDDPLPAPADLEGRAVAAARMLARLHSVDVTTPAFAGEVATDLLAEVARWERALDTVDADLRPGHDRCAAALRAAVPETLPPALLHGDWRLGNMLSCGARVEAVIDWEIWSIGDPRIDLSWFLANTVVDGNVFATRAPSGLPTAATLLAAYEAERGAPIGDLRWFAALTAFKQTATMGLILKRNRRQPHVDPDIEANAPRLPALLEQARQRLAPPAPDPRDQP